MNYAAVPAKRQGTAIAVFTASFTVGSSLSFALSGLLGSAFGWRLGFALLALGPLAAAAIGFAVLPPTPFRQEPNRGRAPLRSLLQNRRALRFVVAYGLHNSEVSIMRAWMMTLLVTSAAQEGMSSFGAYATIVATVANLLGLPLIVLTNEIATRRHREAVIAIVMTLSGLLGLILALAAPLSPIARSARRSSLGALQQRTRAQSIPGSLPLLNRDDAAHFSRFMRFPGLAQPRWHQYCLGCCSMSPAAVIARWPGSLPSRARPPSICYGPSLTF
jgi:MFS family permease